MFSWRQHHVYNIYFSILGVEAWLLSYVISLSLGLGFLKNKEETISLNLRDGGTLDEMCRKMPNPILG